MNNLDNQDMDLQQVTVEVLQQRLIDASRVATELKSAERLAVYLREENTKLSLELYKVQYELTSIQESTVKLKEDQLALEKAQEELYIAQRDLEMTLLKQELTLVKESRQEIKSLAETVFNNRGVAGAK